MKSRLVAVLVMLSTITLGFNSLAQAEQITNNSYVDSSPQINGNYLVWQGHAGGDWEVFLYNITTRETAQITNNDYDDVSPQTDGSYVVWLGFSNSGGEIFLYDILGKETRQITNDSNVDSPPQIANGLVVWASQEVTTSVEPGEIFLYRTAIPETEQLTDNTLDDSSPGINDENIIWVQRDGSSTTVFLYDLPSGPSHEADQGFVWEDSPQTDGNLTVYTRAVGNDREIFVRNSSLRTYEQITENDLQDRYPRIRGNKIVWVGGEGRLSEIFLVSAPIINRLRPPSQEPRRVIRIIGENFGDTQGDSTVHYGGSSFGPGHPRIKLWSDTVVRFRIPKCRCEWFRERDFRWRKVWVTVEGIDSNKKRLKVLRPVTCP